MHIHLLVKYELEMIIMKGFLGRLSFTLTRWYQSDGIKQKSVLNYLLIVNVLYMKFGIIEKLLINWEE